MKKYEAPQLFVDTYVPDTMIASSGPKNGTYNQNCFSAKCPQGYYPNENGDMCNGRDENGHNC